MHLRPRTVLAVVGAVLLLTVFVPGSAQAQEAPSVSVTPSTGLVDGQTVIVSGSGFAAGGITRILQCPPEAGTQPDLSAAVNLCDLNQNVEVFPGPDGDVAPTPFPVQEVMVVEQATTITVVDCAVRQCTIAIGQLVAGGFLSATASIRFGPVGPATKADCRNAGWRNLANDEGQAFANQGQCVAYVVARRP